MAMECGIVATDVGGIPEAVAHGESGLLVKPRNPRALADAALTLLSAPETRRNHAAAARLVVEQRFSMARMTSQLESIYTEVLGARAAGRPVG
jgi:glycosyltransferase involved in cell wall biosynthesis